MSYSKKTKRAAPKYAKVTTQDKPGGQVNVAALSATFDSCLSA
jgi:hypothetical protein